MVSIISHNMCEVNPAACVLQRREQNLWGIMDMMHFLSASGRAKLLTVLPNARIFSWLLAMESTVSLQKVWPSPHPIPVNVALFGDRISAGKIKLKDLNIKPSWIQDGLKC